MYIRRNLTLDLPGSGFNVWVSTTIVLNNLMVALRVSDGLFAPVILLPLRYIEMPPSSLELYEN